MIILLHKEYIKNIVFSSEKNFRHLFYIINLQNDISTCFCNYLMVLVGLPTSGMVILLGIEPGPPDSHPILLTIIPPYHHHLH